MKTELSHFVGCHRPRAHGAKVRELAFQGGAEDFHGRKSERLRGFHVLGEVLDGDEDPRFFNNKILKRINSIESVFGGEISF